MHHTQGLEQYPPNETMSFPARAKVRKKYHGKMCF